MGNGKLIMDNADFLVTLLFRFSFARFWKFSAICLFLPDREGRLAAANLNNYDAAMRD